MESPKKIYWLTAIVGNNYAEMKSYSEDTKKFAHIGNKLVVLARLDKYENIVKFVSTEGDLDNNIQLILNALASGYDEEKLFELTA